MVLTSPARAQPDRLPPGADSFTLRGHAKQPTGHHRRVTALDVDHLGFIQKGGVLDQSRSGRTEHHPTRRSDRLHPLGHPDLLTDGGVTQSTRTDLTSDHLAGVQAHPQPQLDTVALLDVDRKPLRLLLYAQRRQAGAKA